MCCSSGVVSEEYHEDANEWLQLCTTGCRMQCIANRWSMNFHAFHPYPTTVVTLHTSLQTVSARIHVHSLVTVCFIYLPPNDVIPQVDLNHLFSQLAAPFILLGDFNGHSPLWEHNGSNSRGRPIVQLISDHCLGQLNNDEKTYFHAFIRTFHFLDLANCSQPWWNSACHKAKKEQRRA
ncbi:putative RNA-directed DNA polymerase from transposon X-element [Trichonephila clavipes]|nr:putative RNA-directed DNA polymerase from transposon X-element [Trichonephila clavipes]